MNKMNSEAYKEKNTENNKKEKKPFNKKKWREQKYSNKAIVQKWEKIKKRQALRQYNKELKKSNINFKDRGKNNKLETTSRSSFKEAQLKYEKIQKEKEEKRRERERIEKERREALNAYKERKVMKYKKLSQKTRKGQPLMRGRIELLLEKIQKEYVNKNT